ncbi:hypothetical protein [Dermatobacter hominis]|uniref:hypothetical protein n=1 Tax=Dermatobacter hominis TaxID=2884263 RepID=UPI001D11C55F|nr:hypothetical protein [Dermatobacter hominis]UDY37869.1 hypothetical protein LH044_10070 [Dermatobacter hominis]
MNRIHRTATVVLLIVMAAVAAACVPPPPPPDPAPTTAPTTTAAPTTTTTSTSTTTTSTTTTTTAPPTPQELCEEGLQTFVEEADAGTYTSPAYTVSFTGVTAIDNPDSSSSPGHAGSPSTLTVGVTVHDEDGDPVAPSPSQPLVVNIYGGGTGAVSTVPAPLGSSTDPVTIELTSGSSFRLDYDGSYVAAPLTIQGAMQLGDTNGCTGTASWSIGATTVPLLNTIVEDGSAEATLPAVCDEFDEADDGTCPTPTIETTGVRLRAVFGYAEGWPTSATAPPAVSPHSSDYHPFTVDTGSIGAAAPIDELGPNAIGPAGPAYKYYDSSGYQYIGFLYLAPVTIRHAGGTVSTVPIRVLGVETSACVPDHSCNSAPDPEVFHYLGVGFDRNDPSPSDLLASPTDNALLQLQAASGHFAPGYIIDGTGVQVGLTPSQRTGFGTAPLSASGVPGDWLTASGYASVDTTQTTPAIASTILVDTGITEMFFDAGTGTGIPHLLPDSDWVNILLPTTGGVNELTYGFQAGTGHVPAATGMNPSRVDLIHVQPPGQVFVNTGRYVLFENRYLFDARKGVVGFSPQSTPR